MMDMATTIKQKTYLSAVEAAELIGVSRRQILNLCNSDSCPLEAVQYADGFPWLIEKNSAIRYKNSTRKPGPKPKPDR